MLIPPAHASELRPCLGEIERQRFAASRCEGAAGQTSRGATHPVSPASAEASLHARWSGSSAVGRAKIGLPDDAGRWLINLEELPSAVQMGQAAVYQLVLDRKVGEYELPEGASLIACGNRESDRVVVHRMPTPLASRFVHLEIKVVAQDWLAVGRRTESRPRSCSHRFAPRKQARSSPSHRLADSTIVTSDWPPERRPHHCGQQSHRSASGFRPCGWQARRCRIGEGQDPRSFMPRTTASLSVMR